MTRKQIEEKAKEIANKYAALGFKCGLSRERYEAAMEMADWALSHQWVSVEDELPPAKGRGDAISNRVIVRTIDNSYYMDHYDHTYKCWGTELIVKTKVTHWMPIPPIAEEGGEK